MFYGCGIIDGMLAAGIKGARLRWVYNAVGTEKCQIDNFQEANIIIGLRYVAWLINISGQ